MNVAAKIEPDRADELAVGREPVKLNTTDFLQLMHAGAFTAYATIELLNGEIWGEPLPEAGEYRSFASDRVRLFVQDFLTLRRLGALANGVRTELIGGVIYALSPQYMPHAVAQGELVYQLKRALLSIRSHLSVDVEASVALSRYDLPQADIVLTSARKGMGPVPVTSVALVVEIADSSLGRDTGPKADLYSLYGVPEYWVADIGARILHQFWSPSQEGFRDEREVPFGTPVEAVTVRDLTIETDGLA